MILEIQTILKLWRMQNLTIERKITIFKTLMLSKFVYLRFLTGLSIHIIDELIKIQINFFWKKTPTKIQAQNNFWFYFNLDYKWRNKVLLPKFYKKIISNWMIYFNAPPEICSRFLNQFSWYNKFVWINKKLFISRDFKRFCDGLIRKFWKI